MNDLLWLAQRAETLEGALYSPLPPKLHLKKIFSAAIYGLRNKSDISIYILHPKGRVSRIQEAQMTTVTDPNVHNIAVRGNFDDCQASVYLFI